MTRLSPATLRQLETFTLEARKTFMGQRQGSHRSLKRGYGLEFSEYRQYMLGDDPRHIDWGVFARSDRLYIKRFVEEQDLGVLVVLDGSGSMTCPDSRMKWRMASGIAAALSYIALMTQDNARIVVTGSPPSPRFRGPRSYSAVETFLESHPTDASRALTAQHASYLQAASLVRFPGLAVVVSDFLEPMEQIVEYFTILLSRNLEVHAIHVVDPVDIEPVAGAPAATLVDEETSEELNVDLGAGSRSTYRRLFEDHEDALRKHCALSGIRLSRVDVAEPLEDLIIETLVKTRIVR